MKILVVDDHAMVRKGLLGILQAKAGTDPIGEAGSGAEALAQCRAERWDVVVLDINMPGQKGTQVLEQMQREWPDLPVIMLSMNTEALLARWCLAHGAAGYVAKESAPDELMLAIEAALAGEAYVCRAVARHMQADDQPG